MHRICGRSSSGRAPPCQGGGSEFEPRRPLQQEWISLLNMVTWPSGKARVCKTLIHQFKSGRHLQKIPGSFGFRDFLFCAVPCRGRDDLKCAPLLPGCGTQHPHRALGGTRVLLAAAPTTPPCFRRWRRSSSLLHIFSGKNILFRVCRALRSAPNAIFTEGS